MERNIFNKFGKFIRLQQFSKGHLQQMKRFCGFRQAVKMSDFFNSNQMLRFDKQNDYRTFTGGLISIGIITTIIIAFANMILNTVNRSTISYTHNQKRSGDPSLSVITASPQNNFMFGVQVAGYNLSSDYRLFDVVFNQIESNYGQNYTYTRYPLQECTKAHWSMLPEVINKFETLSVGNWLCPTISTIIQLQGKYSTQFYHQMQVTLYPCSNSTDPNRPCGTKEKLNEFIESNGQWNYFTYYYVNSIVNADQPQYKNYYLEDRTYIVFSSTLGAELDMYLKEIHIESDISIWPYEQLEQDSVYYINFSPILYPYSVDNTTSFATFYVMKDPADETYIRQVQKIFVVFSFMGGLIGAIMASLFIINSYTTFAFEIALAISVFRDKDEDEGDTKTHQTHKQLKQQSKGSVNILHFFQFQIYKIVKKFKPNLDWPFIEYIQECREEILFQLDVKGLIKRVIFLEYAISNILQDYQISLMQKQKPIIPSQIRCLREKIEAKEDDKSLQNKSKRTSLISNKPIFLEPDMIIEQSIQGKQASNEQSPHSKTCEICIQSMNSFNRTEARKITIQSSDSGAEKFPKTERTNIRRVRQSAMGGNPISKRLFLNILRKANNEISMTSIENEVLPFPRMRN